MVRRSIERVLQFGSVSKAQLDTDLCFFIAAYARHLAEVKQQIAKGTDTGTCRLAFSTNMPSRLFENNTGGSDGGLDTISS